MRTSNKVARAIYPRYARRALAKLSQLSPSGLSRKAFAFKPSTRSLNRRKFGEDLSQPSAASNLLPDSFGQLPEQHLGGNSTPLLKRAITNPNEDMNTVVKLAEISSAPDKLTAQSHSPLTSAQQHESHQDSESTISQAQKSTVDSGNKPTIVPDEKSAAQHSPQLSSIHQKNPVASHVPVTNPASHHHQLVAPTAPDAAVASHPKEPLTSHTTPATSSVPHNEPALSHPIDATAPVNAKKPDASSKPNLHAVISHKSSSSHHGPPSHIPTDVNAPPLPATIRLDAIPVSSSVDTLNPSQDGGSSSTGEDTSSLPSNASPSPTAIRLNSIPEFSSADTAIPSQDDSSSSSGEDTSGLPSIESSNSDGGSPAATSTVVDDSETKAASSASPIASLEGVPTTQSSSSIPTLSAQPVSNHNTTPFTSIESKFSGTNPNSVSSNTFTPDAHQGLPSNAASSNRLGEALFGVFGSLVFLAVLIAGICFVRRRQNKRTTAEIKVSSGSSSCVSFGAEKSSALPSPGLSSTREINFGVAPAMSPSDPVTRYSQGGVTLLRHLEGITAALDRPLTTASFSSDGGSSMVHTPSTEPYEPNPSMQKEHSHSTKSVCISSPLSGFIETVLASSDVERPLSHYPNMQTSWEDPRRSLLRSTSDDESLNSPFRDEITSSDSHDFFQSIETPTQNSHEGHTFVAGRLAPPNKYDFHVHQGDPHFIIEESA